MTDARRELKELQRGEIAATFLQEIKRRGRPHQYQPLLRALPLLLHQHGLGQTMAYLQSRAAGRNDSPYKVLYDLLGNWLRQQLGLPDVDVLTAISRADSRLYLLASEEAGAFALALRRAYALGQAHAGGEVEPNRPSEVS